MGWVWVKDIRVNKRLKHDTNTTHQHELPALFTTVNQCFYGHRQEKGLDDNFLANYMIDVNFRVT